MQVLCSQTQTCQHSELDFSTAETTVHQGTSCILFEVKHIKKTAPNTTNSSLSNKI